MYTALRKECDWSMCHTWAVGFLRIHHVLPDNYVVDTDRPYCKTHLDNESRVWHLSQWQVVRFDTLAEFREDRYDR